MKPLEEAWVRRFGRSSDGPAHHDGNFAIERSGRRSRPTKRALSASPGRSGWEAKRRRSRPGLRTLLRHRRRIGRVIFSGELGEAQENSDKLLRSDFVCSSARVERCAALAAPSAVRRPARYQTPRERRVLLGTANQVRTYVDAAARVAQGTVRSEVWVVAFPQRPPATVKPSGAGERPQFRRSNRRAPRVVRRRRQRSDASTCAPATARRNV